MGFNCRNEFLHQRGHFYGWPYPLSYRVLAKVIKKLRKNRFEFKKYGNK